MESFYLPKEKWFSCQFPIFIRSPPPFASGKDKQVRRRHNDLRAHHWGWCDYVIPSGKANAVILKIGGVLIRVNTPMLSVIGTIGAVPAFKAIYLNRSKPKCAYVGDGSNLPWA